MDGQLTNRFDFLEQRLQRLENTALLGPETQKIAAQTELETGEAECETSVSDGPGHYCGEESERPRDQVGPALISSEEYAGTPGTRPFAAVSPQPKASGGAGTRSSLTHIANADESRIMSDAKLGVLQISVIRDCRERLTALVEEAVDGAAHRLRGMADQTIFCFMADIEKALQKSAGVIASQTIALLEQEIQIATRHSFYAGLAGMKSNSVISVAETGRAHPGKVVVSSQDGRRSWEEAERELSTAVEAIQSSSAALLANLDTRLHATLQAFEENTAKQLAANFQKTARELMEREIESLRKPYGNLDQQALEAGTTPRSPGAATERSALQPATRSGVPAAASTMDSKVQAADPLNCEIAQKQRKPRKKESTWRILGLS
ncbi:MAG: hypothetical protein ACRD2P_00220 [Terriglobia bacterium]